MKEKQNPELFASKTLQLRVRNVFQDLNVMQVWNVYFEMRRTESPGAWMDKPLYNDLESLIRPNKEVYRESGPWVFCLLDFYLAPSGRLTSTASTSAAASAQVLDWQIHTHLRVTDWKYREWLARLEKSQILKLCLKNAFREPLSKILFPFS